MMKLQTLVLAYIFQLLGIYCIRYGIPQMKKKKFLAHKYLYLLLTNQKSIRQCKLIKNSLSMSYSIISTNHAMFNNVVDLNKMKSCELFVNYCKIISFLVTEVRIILIILQSSVAFTK